MLTKKIQEISGTEMLLEVDDHRHDVKAWAHEEKGFVNEHLSSHGALLVRGFEEITSTDFAATLKILFGEELLNYNYRSTPRTGLANNVYTATEYHNSEVIPQHNEKSYANSWPLRIGFLSSKKAREGGNTPISDSREAYMRIPREVVEEFERKGVMYVRNYGNIDLPWSEVFQTEDKVEVERFCKANDIDFVWTENGLRTKQVNQATATHPHSGEKVWFNQAHLFHVSNLKPDVMEGLLEYLGEENLPRNTFFGDGTPLDVEVLNLIRQVYDETKITFDWQEGDLLLLDNMLYTHGREPYEGEREVLVGMAQKYGLQA